jgi:uncharacterized membrane protein YbaN (DUF454 family)
LRRFTTNPQKAFYLALGLSFLGLGILGAFIPVLPTTPFVIVAAYFFSKSSPRLEQWLNQHPFFGPNIEAWKKHRAIPLKAKMIACFFMTLSTLTILLRDTTVIKKVILISIILVCAIYVATRPSPPQS